MPIYDYACDTCGHISEHTCRIAEKPDAMTCSCGGTKLPIITLGHGGIFRVQPSWIDSGLRETLQDSDAILAGTERPIEDRDDYRRFLRDHPTIEPI